MKIAMISEHAGPPAALGGDDAGGQNVHVAALAEELPEASLVAGWGGQTVVLPYLPGRSTTEILARTSCGC